MKLLLVLVLLITMVCANPALTSPRGTNDFKFCEPPKVPQPFETIKIVMEPEVPAPGQIVKTIVTGIIKETFNGGTLVSEIYKAGVKLFSFKYDICKISSEPCPIKPGTYNLTITQATPRFAFSGDYEAHNKAHDNENNPLSCVVLPFSIKRKSKLDVITDQLKLIIGSKKLTPNKIHSGFL
jgi:hypothetical protein